MEKLKLITKSKSPWVEPLVLALVGGKYSILLLNYTFILFILLDRFLRQLVM